MAKARWSMALGLPLVGRTRGALVEPGGQSASAMESARTEDAAVNQLDLSIVNGAVFLGGELRRMDIGVSGGKIVQVSKRGSLRAAKTTMDVSGKWVLPGFVDAHFHCRAPDHPEREDFSTGTMAAAAGGVTTVLEMPIADVGTTTAARLRYRSELAASNAFVDFGLFGGGGTLSRREVDGMAAGGAVGFKIFTHSPHAARRESFDGLWLVNNGDLQKALELAVPTGRVTAFHAEDEELLRHYAGAPRRGLNQYEAYCASRPALVEAMAVARLCVLSEATNAPIHIVHLTSRHALDVARSARARGVRVTVETCGHYLAFTQDDFERCGVDAKVAPPLRPADDTKAMLEGVNDGSIDMICSDHAPFLRSDRTGVSIADAPSGLPGVEAYAHLALNAALEGWLDVSRTVHALTSGPAQVYGIAHRKGALKEGLDADIVVFDPGQSCRFDTSTWYTKARESARLFDGVQHRGRVVGTIVRGQTVYLEGRIVGQRGWGMQVEPREQSGSGVVCT